MIREIVYGLLGLLFFLYAAEWYLASKDDAREPKSLHSTVPLVGHLFNILRHGTRYWGMTGKSTPLEIYTLRIFTLKLYVANTARLLAPIQKSRSLSFGPFLRAIFTTIPNGSIRMQELYDASLSDELSHAQRASLLPGPNLDAQNLRTARRALIDVDDFVQSESRWLNDWVKHTVVQATSCGIFGERHPFQDRKVEDAFWVWNDYGLKQLFGADFTGIGHRVRNIVQDSFRKHYTEQPPDASEFMQSPRQKMVEAGFSLDDCIKFDSAVTLAAFPNTVPTLYWVIWDIFRQPVVLQEVREELKGTAVSGDAETGFTLDVPALRTKCPLLLSCYQETQRYRHTHANVRKVLEDMVLDDKYLLKKNSYLLMPGDAIHRETSMWGSSANQFNPYRFMQDEANGSRGEKNLGGKLAEEETGSVDGAAERLGERLPMGGFVPWGNAPNLCPARQYATTKILVIVALLVMRVDMEPESGQWDQNPKLLNDFSTLHSPAEDVKMKLTKRERWQGTWAVEMGEHATSRIPLASR